VKQSASEKHRGGKRTQWVVGVVDRGSKAVEMEVDVGLRRFVTACDDLQFNCLGGPVHDADDPLRSLTRFPSLPLTDTSVQRVLCRPSLLALSSPRHSRHHYRMGPPTSHREPRRPAALPPPTVARIQNAKRIVNVQDNLKIDHHCLHAAVGYQPAPSFQRERRG
jgi:hypothetical protein